MEYYPPLHFAVVAIEKGAFGSPSTKVTNFTLTIERGINIVILSGQKWVANGSNHMELTVF